MAVSKTQNERPAITALIDLANQLEGESNTHARNIETLTQGLSDEVSDRETADTQLEQAIQDEAEARAQAVQAEAEARAQAVQAEATARMEANTAFTNSLDATNAQVLALTNDVDTLEQETVPPLQTFVNRFRTGLTESLTIAASGSQSGNVTFNTPYEDTAQICVFPCCVGASELFTNLECQLISATYSGFSYNIVNTDTNSHTIAVGFVAVQVN